jgi:iron uptake system component EfeO
VRLGAVALFGLIIGCASENSGASSEDLQVVEVALTDAGCDPADIIATAGRAKFVVTNEGASAVTEFEILSGGGVVAEVENVIEGLRGELTVDLRSGEYETYCPGGTTAEHGTISVSS